MCNVWILKVICGYITTSEIRINIHGNYLFTRVIKSQSTEALKLFNGSIKYCLCKNDRTGKIFLVYAYVGKKLSYLGGAGKRP